MHLQLDDHERAVPLLKRSLSLYQALDVDRHGQSITHDSLGFAHYLVGDYDLAIVQFQHALAGFRAAGDLYNQSDTLIRLGNAYRDRGDGRAARAAWEQALAILDDLGLPTTAEVRARLTDAPCGVA